MKKRLIIGVGILTIACVLLFTHLYLQSFEAHIPPEVVATSANNTFVPYGKRAWGFYPDSQQRYGVRYPDGLVVHPFKTGKETGAIEGSVLRQVGGVSFSALSGDPGAMGVNVFDDPSVRTFQEWVAFQNRQGFGSVEIEKAITIDAHDAWVTHLARGGESQAEQPEDDKKTIIVVDGKIFEIWTKFHNDPIAHERAWEDFRFLKIYEHNPDYDKKMEAYYKEIEERTIQPIEHCLARDRACDVEIDGLNVVVHVPKGRSLTESFQDPTDSGLVRWLQIHDGDRGLDDVVAYATSPDYAVGIGEGMSPYSGPVLDLTKPLEEALASFPRPNSRSPRVIEMDGKKGLLFYWMGDMYGGYRTFEAMLVIPTPGRDYSNIVFPISLEMTDSEKPKFGVGDMDNLIASHQQELSRKLGEIDQYFDIE
jgi:hypothetical protein